MKSLFLKFWKYEFFDPPEYLRCENSLDKIPIQARYANLQQFECNRSNVFSWRLRQLKVLHLPDRKFQIILMTRQFSDIQFDGEHSHR